MSTISKLPFELLNLSKDLNVPSVPHSGWPPPSTLSLSRTERNNVFTTTNIQSSSSTPLFIDEVHHHHHQKRSIGNNGKSYFEKVRSVAEDRCNDDVKSHLTTANDSTFPGNHLDDALENLIESIQPSSARNSNDMKNNKSQADILLRQFELLKQIYIDNGTNKTMQKEEFQQSAQQRFDTYTFPIITPDGNILFDFSKQSINYNIYIELMQLVRLSNLDKWIQKIFHKSGEYHHVDYKEKRRNQLERDQENHQNLSDHFIYGFYQNPTVNHLNSYSSIHTKHQLSSKNSPLKSHEMDKNNCFITMAKAVHFRASSHCFVLDGIDISSRFQYDRNVLRDTCLRFHSAIDIGSNTKQTENDDSSHTASLSDCTARSTMVQLNSNTNRTIPFVAVLCTDKMKQIYRLLESLLKSYVSPNISIIYITFDQIESILTKYEQRSYEIVEKDTPKSFAFENSHNIFSSTMPIVNNKLNQSTGLVQPANLKKEVNTNAIINDQNTIMSTSEKTPLTLSSKTDDTINKIDLSNEEFLLDYLRTSSLVLILMKHLDETYLTAFIRWYIEVLLNSDFPSTSRWNKTIEHFWLITSDYQRAETVFNIPKTNLFLWPTEHNDFDHMSIIISSILSLPIALSINYEIYSMFIDGMSIVDKHCQQTAIDRNVCIYMALSRIWSRICERKTTVIITCDDNLQYFSEYAQTLLAEFDDIYKRKMIGTYKSIHGIPSAKIFLQQISNEQNHFSYDLIAISEISQKIETDRKLFLNSHVPELLTISSELYEIEKTLQTNQASHPHTLILLDQLTPLTLGVLMGIYQLSIFFENIIYNQQNMTLELNQLQSDE